MTPKYSPILWWPQKYIHKIFIPQKIFIFLKIPKNIEIQNFEPQKMTLAYVCMKISEYRAYAKFRENKPSQKFPNLQYYFGLP